MQEGFQLKFHTRPPLRESPPNFSQSKHIGFRSPRDSHSSPPTTKHYQGGACATPQNVLFSDFYMPQEGWVKQTNHRLVRSEQIPGYSKVQNGTCSYHQAGLMRSPVGMHSGYKKRISQCSNMVQTPEIPGILDREVQETPSFRVPVSSVRPVPGPLGLPQDSQTNKEPSKGLNDPSGVLSGRFRFFRNLESRTEKSLPGISTNPEKAQPVNQLGEVGFHPQALPNLPGSEIRPPQPFSLAPRGEDSFG